MAKKFSAEWWAAQRPEVVGKETEKLVEAVLKDQNERAAFAWHRMPDAKAARGLIGAQPADYLIASTSDAYFLEVKALKHEYRLPRDRVSQLPTLKKFEMAGMRSFVLVHHYLTGVWRIARAIDLYDAAASWDMREVGVLAKTPTDALILTGVIK